jgi:hypothetical protein
VKLMPPSYVKAYLKRSKNDANDAAAICEAVDAAINAVRSDQDEGATGRLDAAPGPTVAGAQCCTNVRMSLSGRRPHVTPKRNSPLRCNIRKSAMCEII